MELYVCQKLSCDLKDDGRKTKLRKFLLPSEVVEKNINNRDNNKICK